MENSVLSDAAGVQKNIAKMYEEHAKSIGKTTDSLTQAEKVQAVYNGIMDEAAMFTGSAAEMANGYQGVQAQLNATNLELSRTIGESMIPALTQYKSLQLSLTKGIADFAAKHKGATSGTITFTTAILATVVAVTAIKKALISYTATTGVANTATKALTTSMLANPLFIGGLAISAGLAALNMFNTAMQESIDKMQENTEKAQSVQEILNNFLKNGEYTEAEASQATSIKDETQQIITAYEERKNKIDEIQKQIDENFEKYKNKEIAQPAYTSNLTNLTNQLNSAKNALNKYLKENEIGEKDIETFRKRVDMLSKTLEVNTGKQEYSRLTNQKAHRETLVNIAQTKADIKGKQQLLNVLKQGKTTTEEYTNAKNQLVKTYPELAKVNENTINSTQAAIDAENAAADAEWANAQIAIQASILEVNAMMSNKEQIEQLATATQQSVEQVTTSLQNQINILSNLAKLTPDDFKGSVTPTYTPRVSKSSGASTYSNKRLDNYKKEIEHKKALDQLSLQDEINMYQYALNRYAKTQDEKWELQEKIYSLQKELQEKELTDYTQQIEHKKALDQITLQEEIAMYNTALNQYAKTTEKKQELREKLYELNKELAQKEKETLDQQTQDYENYIEEQKRLQGASYTVEKQTSDYDKIIRMHKNYLDQIMKDERLGLEERKSIYREELSVVRDYEQKKRDLRIQSIDNTASQLTNAITKKLQEMQNKEKELLDENLSTVENWKSARINAINEEYDARIEAIERELAALDKAEQQKTRAEEDAEYEKKKLRLEQLVEFEHDATTKANYQKELDKLIAEHQKTLDNRALSDKKDALNEQKELLKNEQDEKIQQIELETEKRKEEYDKQLKALEEHYDKQIAKAEETAQTMLLNVEQNQNQILELLQSYGDAYEITGQTFGEKLGQSFADVAMEKVQNAISKIQTVIDNAIASNISRLSQSVAKIEGSGTTGNTTINKTVNVEQNNTITSPVDSPSILAKKQETLNRDLANSIARVF